MLQEQGTRLQEPPMRVNKAATYSLQSEQMASKFKRLFPADNTTLQRLDEAS